jgi:hypothetical protein
MTANFSQCFKSLDAIHNIGVGLEDDPNRAGYKLLRVEPQEYFFNNTILMECDHIEKLERKLDSSMIFSTMKVGYQKLETWNNNGLYDLFGMRTYRTELSQLKNELDKSCPFIASDYAIEFTRRLFGLTTADSRYDNDTFILCLENIFTGRIEFQDLFVPDSIVLPVVFPGIQVGDSIVITGTVSNNGTFTVATIGYNATNTYITTVEAITPESAPNATFEDLTNPIYLVEQDNITNPFKISQPETVFNYRITPAHNALRQFKTIIMSASDWLTAKIYFTSGNGNFYAFGWIDDACALESSVLGEGVNININNFGDVNNARPLYKPELITYEYPMAWEDFLVIYANPYGLIGFQQGETAKEYGWIEDLSYDPYNGMAKFVLRPRFNQYIILDLGAGVLLEGENFLIAG